MAAFEINPALCVCVAFSIFFSFPIQLSESFSHSFFLLSFYTHYERRLFYLLLLLSYEKKAA